MKKEFLSTIEEATEAHFRLMEMMGTVRQHFWITFALGTLVILALIFALPTGSWSGRIFMGTLAVAIFLLIHIRSNENALKKQIRKILVKALGTDQPIPCIYELTPDGVIFKRQGTELKLAWSSAKSIRMDGKTLEILYQPTGIVSISKQIFNDPREMEAWIHYIQNKIPPSTSV